MSIPAKEIELKIERELNEKLLKEGKKKFVVCCQNSRDVIYSILEMGITKNEFHILINTFNKHPYDRFGRNKYRVAKTKEIDYKSLINEIFEISELFENIEIKSKFLEYFFELVQKENSSSGWAITLAKFNKHWKNKQLGNSQNHEGQNSSDYKVINMKIENVNNYANLQIADTIINGNSELESRDAKFIQLICDKTIDENDRKKLIESLKIVRSSDSTIGDKKKSGGMLNKFIESVSAEGGKQLTRELFNNGDKIIDFLLNIPFNS